MNKIQISSQIKKSVKGTPKYRIIGDTVVVNRGNFKNGRIKYTNCKIVQISQTGIYCDNDEFYAWDLFN